MEPIPKARNEYGNNDPTPNKAVRSINGDDENTAFPVAMSLFYQSPKRKSKRRGTRGRGKKTK